MAVRRAQHEITPWLHSWVKTQSLCGQHVRLERLNARHLPGLVQAASVEPERNFAFTTPPTEQHLRQIIRDAGTVRNCTRLPFAVIDPRTDTPIGSSSYLNIDSSNRALEVGFTWYTPAVQRTPVNTETKLLLLTEAFENLHVIRLQFRVDGRNIRSQT